MKSFQSKMFTVNNGKQAGVRSKQQTLRDRHCALRCIALRVINALLSRCASIGVH